MSLSLLKELLVHRTYIEQRLKYFRKKVHPIMTKEKLQMILSGIKAMRADQTDKAKIRADLEGLFNSPEGNSFKKIVYSTLGKQKGIVDDDQAQHYGREHFGDDIAL